MTKQSKNIISVTALHIRQYLLQHLPSRYLYHNYEYADEIADVTKKLGKDAGLNDEELEILQLAAWFHVSGYAVDEHRVAESSIQIMRDFLSDQDYPKEQADSVAQLIRSVHDDLPPQSDLESILSDAIFSFLGRKRFKRRAQLMRLQEEQLQGKRITPAEWNDHLLDLFIRQPYLTTWARDRYTRRRNSNLADLRMAIYKDEEKSIRRKTGKNFGRGVDTLYRVTLTNHIELSNIADGKANMIISINTLVLSILITASAAGISIDKFNFGERFFDVLPIFILMLTSLSTIAFAVFSAMPKVSGNTFTKEDVKQNKVSMLFFGNFLQAGKSFFLKYLRELKYDQEALYDDLSRDLYNLGLVLDKKYRLLNIAYRIFIGGLMLSFVAFILAYFV
ncbi:MAG: Pycsar system effector family protein [Bacteroidota bacterium]